MITLRLSNWCFRIRFPTVSIFLLSALLSFSLSNRGSAADRIALVIGVDQYRHLPTGAQLRVAVRDAGTMKTTLEDASPKFSVTRLSNPTRPEAAQAIADFMEAAAGADCALFYFAGHGIQYHGENYLLFKDLQIAKIHPEVRKMKERLGIQAIRLQGVLNRLEDTGAKVKLVFLDCCRDNPLDLVAKKEGGAASRSLIESKDKTGLGTVESPSGSLISFAADRGQKANDGLFTPVLCRNLLRPDTRIMEVLALTRQEVKQTSTSWYREDEQIGLAEERRRVIHEPIEYNKLNPEGLRFSFVGPGVSRAFTNTLGMKFVEVPGTDVLFCEHETRVRDFEAFVKATGYRGGDDPIESVDEWLNCEYKSHKQTGEHPVVNVSWHDARAFCAWLTEKEKSAGRVYRLPGDHEWSIAVGIGDREDPNASPEDKDGKINIYPWGDSENPPAGYGNFSGQESAFVLGKLENYRDQHPFTAPVKSYRATNRLFDLSGNVWEWCEDKYDKKQ